MPNKLTLQKEIEIAINRASAECASDTPDFILAEYLADCLAAWNKASIAREKWYGRGPRLAENPPAAPSGVALPQKQYEGSSGIACKSREYTLAELAENTRLYMDLIYAVGRKYDGESRHETAKRYIIEREAASNETGAAGIPDA